GTVSGDAAHPRHRPDADGAGPGLRAERRAPRLQTTTPVLRRGPHRREGNGEAMAVVSKNITPPDRVPVRRALISVSDKTGLTELAGALARRGVEIVSTGGTAKAIAAAGLPV